MTNASTSLGKFSTLPLIELKDSAQLTFTWTNDYLNKFRSYVAGIYLFEVNNGNIRTVCTFCPKTLFVLISILF